VYAKRSSFTLSFYLEMEISSSILKNIVEYGIKRHYLILKMTKNFQRLNSLTQHDDDTLLTLEDDPVFGKMLTNI
jgi:hypothetical protein